MGCKHRYENPNPIMQISPIEYFSQDQEALPDWLAKHKRGEKVDFSQLLASRIVYYPGSALEGSPIHVFNAAHAAHVYLYIDYGFPEEEIESWMSERIPAGYHLYDEKKVQERDILPHAPHYHLNEDEQRYVMDLYQTVRVPTQNAFGLLKIYERDGSHGEEHGAQRFAVLFLGADAIATYDAIFGNTHAKPFACIIGAYSFDGSYEGFGKNSLLEKIAQRIDRLPKYLVCVRDYGWNGYRMLKTVGGTYGRFVWVKDNGDATLDGFDEYLRNILVFSD